MKKSKHKAMIHGYGFVTRTSIPPREFVASVVHVAGIRFAGRTVGSCVAVVAAEVRSLAVLQDDVIPAVANRGAKTVTWTVASRNALMFNMPVKKGKSAYSALVRVRTPRPAEAIAGMQETFDSLNAKDLKGHHASALQTYGADCDVLLDVGTPDEASLFQQIDRLDNLPAVSSYEIALAHWPGNGHWNDD